MARMTEEEAWALDEEVTRNPPNVAGKPGGFFTDRRDRLDHKRYPCYAACRKVRDMKILLDTNIVLDILLERL